MNGSRDDVLLGPLLQLLEVARGEAVVALQDGRVPVGVLHGLVDRRLDDAVGRVHVHQRRVLEREDLELVRGDERRDARDVVLAEGRGAHEARHGVEELEPVLLVLGFEDEVLASELLKALAHAAHGGRDRRRLRLVALHRMAPIIA
jgi:hypothetical protein